MISWLVRAASSVGASGGKAATGPWSVEPDGVGRDVGPDPAWLPWLADRIAAEKPFIGYHAAVALLSAARAVPDESLDAVDGALTTAVESSSRLRADTDRATTTGADATIAGARPGWSSIASVTDVGLACETSPTRSR